MELGLYFLIKYLKKENILDLFLTDYSGKNEHLTIYEFIEKMKRIQHITSVFYHEGWPVFPFFNLFNANIELWAREEHSFRHYLKQQLKTLKVSAKPIKLMTFNDDEVNVIL